MMIGNLQKKYSEHEIVEGIKNNNKAIITNLTKRLKPSVFRWIKENSGTKKDAEDNFNDTWEEVLIKVRTGRYKEGYFEAYFKQIYKNIWLKKLRDRGIERKTDVLNNEMKDLSEEERNAKIAKDNNIDIVHQHFMKLDKKCREILTKKHMKDIKVKDIAVQMNSTENFVKVKLFRCRQRLLELLKNDPDFTIE